MFPLVSWFIFRLFRYFAQVNHLRQKIDGIFGSITFIIMLYFFQETDFANRPFAGVFFYSPRFVNVIIAIFWLVIIWLTKGFFDNSGFKYSNSIGNASFFVSGFHWLCFHLHAAPLIKLELLTWSSFLLFVFIFYSTYLVLDLLKSKKWPDDANSQILNVFFGS